MTQPSKPIEVFIAQIEDGVALATAANAPYSPAQIVAIAYHVRAFFYWNVLHSL